MMTRDKRINFKPSWYLMTLLFKLRALQANKISIKLFLSGNMITGQVKKLLYNIQAVNISIKKVTKLKNIHVLT